MESFKFLLIITCIINLVLILSKLLDSTKTSGPPGSDQTNLTTRRSRLGNGRRTTDVLVVSSSEGMLHGILCHTPNLGPAVPLNGVLVVSTSSLEEGLISTSTSGDNSDLGTDIGLDSLLSSRWETDTGGTLLVIVGNDDSETSRSTGELSTVTGTGFNVADNGSLGNLLQRKNISAGKGGLLSAVDELSGVHTLGGNHELSVPLVAVSIQELDLGNGCTSSGVMEDLLDDTTDVAATFGIIDGAELDGSLTSAHMRLEDGGLTLPLRLSDSI